MATRRMKLDNASIKRLRNEEGDPWFIVRDSVYRRLFVRVYPPSDLEPTGARHFAVRAQCNGKQVYFVLPFVPGESDLPEVRAAAAVAVSRIKRGEHPGGAPSDKPRTLRELFEAYQQGAAAEKTRRLLSQRQVTAAAATGQAEEARRYDAKLFENYLSPWAGLAVQQITRPLVLELHDRITKQGKSGNPAPMLANTVVQLLTKLYRFGQAEDWSGLRGLSLPTRRIQLNEGEPRGQVVEDEQWRPLFAAIDQEEDIVSRVALKFIALTGKRRNEIRSARWENIDLDAGVLTIPSTKTGARDEVALTPYVAGLLRDLRPFTIASGNVCSGIRGELKDLFFPWSRVRAVAGLRGLRLHDFRHNMATVLGRVGVAERVIQACLNHKPKAMTRRYQHPSLNDKREALEKAERYILARAYPDSSSGEESA